MKQMKFYILLLLLLATSFVTAQTVDSVNMPLYLKTRQVPSFKLLKMDSATFFYKYQLKKKTPTIIVYFNPDCDHCQTEAQKIVDSIGYLKHTQILFISSAPFAQIKKFSQDYKLINQSNITVGYDPQFLITRFYKVNYTPFVATYNGSGNLVNVYEGGTTVTQLSKLKK
jgi:peroxiredoxin